MNHKEELFLIEKEHLSYAGVKKDNKGKKFVPGYHKELDCVIISKDGTLGEIYEIQGLRIGIPATPKEVNGSEMNKKDQVFRYTAKPDSLKKIKTVVDFNKQSDAVKNKYYPYIDKEFNRRDNGHWFMCNGEATYITGSHYFYLNWAKIDVGQPAFRQANRLFFYFWEACKIDHRTFGMCYLKNRRSGFSFMAASETMNLATRSKNSRFGILSKSGGDAKKLFTDKVVPMSKHLPFFFKPIQAGSDNPKTELAYQVPSTQITKKSWKEGTDEDTLGVEGLDTTIDYKSTEDNSYDGEKLKLLVHDESGKWDKGKSIQRNWRVTQTCLRLGSNVVGKCIMGSTSNKLDSGGQEFKDIYYSGDLRKVKRSALGRTPSGLYSFFINAYWNYEGTFDKYGWPVFETPENPVMGIDGNLIYMGSIESVRSEADNLRETEGKEKAYEFTRQFPATEKEAFRDEITASLFNLEKIYQQIDWNEENGGHRVVQGSFQWENGIKDSQVIWTPNPNGRFRATWLPPKEMRNIVVEEAGIKYPGNKDLLCGGVDSYDISGTVDGSGSNGALHILSGFSMVSQIPNNQFVLEYISRPQTAEVFFEDILMALVYYGAPALIENNKPRLLYHLKRRGYRGYALNRPDKSAKDLSVTEIELGGIPNTSEDIKQAHAAAIESYIDKYVGVVDHKTGGYGNMYLSRTLEDWSRFDINNRTTHDASISSGLAAMGINRLLYRPHGERGVAKISLNIPKYNNDGLHGTPVQRSNPGDYENYYKV